MSEHQTETNQRPTQTAPTTNRTTLALKSARETLHLSWRRTTKNISRWNCCAANPELMD